MTIRTLTIEPFGLVGNSNPEVSVTISLVDGNEQRIQGLVTADGSSVIDRVTLDIHQESRTVDLYPQPDLDPVLNFGSDADQSMSYYLVDILNKRTRYHHQFRTQVDVGDPALSWAEFANGQGPLEGGQLPGWATHIADAGIHVPPGGLTRQSLVKASDTDGDTEWVESDGAPGITEDIVVSVGPGQDYETLFDAFAFIQAHPLALGYSPSGNQPSKAVSFTLTLVDGVHADGSQCRLTGVVATVSIVGSDVASVTVGDALHFHSCPDIRMYGLTAAEVVATNATCLSLVGFSTNDEPLSVAIVRFIIAKKSLVVAEAIGDLANLEVGSGSTLIAEELANGDDVLVEVYSGGAIICSRFSFSLTNESPSSIIHIGRGGYVAVSEANFSSVYTLSEAILAYSGGVFVAESVTLSGVNALASFPVNQVQPTGSAVYDGSTGATLDDYGETAQDGGAVSGAVTVDISQGQSVELTLSGDAASFAISNPSGHVATSFALLLDTGGFDVLDWTDVTGWFGAAPDLSSGGTHGFGFELIGGAWYGSHKGQVV